MAHPVLVIHCSKSGKQAIENMTHAGMKLPEGIKTFEFPCTGRVNDVILMESLQNGMDGILLVGCRKDNCTYIDGNVKAEKRLNRVKSLLEGAGITNKHVDMIFTAPDESRRLHDYLKTFYSKVNNGTEVQEKK